MHYKLKRRNEYENLVYGVEDSEEWPAWNGKDTGGRIGIVSVRVTGTPLFRYHSQFVSYVFASYKCLLDFVYKPSIWQ